ncbi:MAG: DNA polymerase II large subunit [Candidatus Micrarchaeota archaeon]
MSEIESYFSTLKDELTKAYGVATEARKKGYDPIDDVEVKIAKDVAARVEGIVGPPNIAKVIREMEANGMAREDIAFEIAKKIAAGEIIKGSKEFMIEQAVRTGVGILTEGVLVAPTEGISKVRIRTNPDGSDFVAVYYAGPIRSAGGTAAALSVLLADVARRVAGVGDYRVTDTQVERYVEEITVYEARVAHLQYFPPEEHIKIVVRNCPICVDGDPTEEVEVSAYKNVPGVETDRIRGGMPLVICEGIAQKAAKVLKFSKKQNLGWNWLESIIKIKSKEEKVEIKPDDSYLEGLVAGRPVFAYPSAKGGFRLRYGRSETNGLMGKNIHPAIMTLLDDFLAYGTHMKIERPGKGCIIVPHSGLEPPVVKLNSGRVMRVHSVEEAMQIRASVSEILFLGDMLITYGDFLKANHPLLPPGYCKEIWELEVREKGVEPAHPKNAAEAFDFARLHGVPLHSDYTLPWHDITLEELQQLRELMKTAVKKEKSLELLDGKEKIILEKLFLEHRLQEGKIILDENAAVIIEQCTAVAKDMPEAVNTLDAVAKLSGVLIKPWAPTYIGGRMGRPEKAKERPMAGSPTVLFPTGSQKNRSLIKEMKNIKGTNRSVNLELGRLRCKGCGKVTFYRKCHLCGGEARPEKVCVKCGKAVDGEMHCGEKTTQHDLRPIDLVQLFESAKSRLGFAPEELKGIKGLSNADRVPERIEKGFIRSKHEVYVFRDGTIRFDATDVPMTHFIPKEIGLSLEQVRKLGYLKDYLGNELATDAQLVMLYPQDIVLSKHGLEYVHRISKFIDELLVNLYGVEPYYKAEKPTDMIGHLTVGLSPHTSAGVLCRIIGYTDANVGYGHPYYHTAKRRNCFAGDTILPVFEGGNFRMITIEELVEKNLKNPKKDDFGTMYCKVTGNIKTIAYNEKKKRFELAPITHVSKHGIKETINLRTKGGREITVTPDHPFPTSEGKKPAQTAKKLICIAKDAEYKQKIEQMEAIVDEVERILPAEKQMVYSLTVAPHHTLIANGIVAHQCDGDEDAIMLLLDCLINFSKRYLTENRGGTMDAPLVLTNIINPKEVDDEAYCIEMVSSYPLEFYRACEQLKWPSDVKLRTVKNVLGTDEQYYLPLTLPGTLFNGANTKTSYVKLESVPEKVQHEFALHDKIRAVNQRDAAERMILSHFIPDLYGNLRSFSRQEFRCAGCNQKYRRVPLLGRCRRCGGNLLLTINKGGIEKYLTITKEVVKRYELAEYLSQRLDLIQKEIGNIFEDEKKKQLGLSDFV